MPWIEKRFAPSYLMNVAENPKLLYKKASKCVVMLCNSKRRKEKPCKARIESKNKTARVSRRHEPACPRRSPVNTNPSWGFQKNQKDLLG